ncbi:MAG: carbohydrate ABC transporter permease [Ruminococcaceae bacterium]|nr:carbohydrate ABC transporter permease [Oscillospiraceae bacterium]
MKESIGYRIFKFFLYILMAVISAVCLVPFLHTLAKALNDGNDTMRGGITIFPRAFTWQNFQTLLADTSLYRAALVSVAIVITVVVTHIAIQFMSAYVLSNEDLPGRRKIMLFTIIPTFITGGTIPTYILFANLGLLNNFMVYWLPGLYSFYNVMILRSYIESSVPMALREAAKLDGAGEIRTMIQIVFPLCKPVLATVALWLAVGAWNNWSTTLMYITDPDLFNLQYKLMEVIKESERLQQLLQQSQMTGEVVNEQVKSTPESLQCAQVIITTLPIVMVYPFLQKYFVKGVTIGAVK